MNSFLIFWTVLLGSSTVQAIVITNVDKVTQKAPVDDLSIKPSETRSPSIGENALRSHTMASLDSALVFVTITLGAGVLAFGLWSFMQNPGGTDTPCDGSKDKTSSQDGLSAQEWTVVFIMCMASFVSTSLISIIAPIVPIHLSKLGVTPIWSGLVFTAPSLASLLFSPFCSGLNAKYGRKTMVKLGLATQGVTALVFGQTSAMFPEQMGLQLGVFLACRVVEGIASAVSNIGMNSIVLDAISEQQLGKVMGLNEAMVGAGFSLGPPIGALIYDAGGFATPFIVAFVAFLMSTMGAVLLPSTDSEVGNSSNVVPISSVLSWRMVSIAGIAFCGTGIFGLVEPTYAVHGKNDLNLSAPAISGMLALLSIVYSLASPFAGTYADKIGRGYVMSFSTCLAAMGLIGLGMATATPIFPDTTLHTAAEVVFITMMGIGQAGMLVPTMPAMKDTLPAGSPASATDAVATVFSNALTLGLVVAPLLGAIFTESMGFGHTMVVCGVAIASYGATCLQRSSK